MFFLFFYGIVPKGREDRNSQREIITIMIVVLSGNSFSYINCEYSLFIKKRFEEKQLLSITLGFIEGFVKG